MNKMFDNRTRELLDDSELNEIIDAIEFNGYELNDFIFETKLNAVSSKIQVPIEIIQGTIKITRVSQNISISYQAGHGSSISSDFDNDLTHGKFGNC